MSHTYVHLCTTRVRVLPWMSCAYSCMLSFVISTSSQQQQTAEELSLPANHICANMAMYHLPSNISSLFSHLVPHLNSIISPLNISSLFSHRVPHLTSIISLPPYLSSFRSHVTWSAVAVRHQPSYRITETQERMALPALAALVVVMCCCCWCYRRQRGVKARRGGGYTLGNTPTGFDF